jgi:hypothetical protein
MIPAVMALVLGAVLACASVAGAAAAPARDKLTNFICQKALAPTSRQTSVTAVMRPLAGTLKMQMEIQLLSRTPSATSFSAVSIPAQSKLDTWITAPGTLGQRPGDVWKETAPVADLPAPASYRFEVDFRWVGADGKVLGTAQRLSSSCHELELRPQLAISSFTVHAEAGHPQLDRDVAVIANSGATAAKDFEVQFSDGTKLVTDTVARIGAHASRTLTFDGPACAVATPPTLTVDPQHVVDEIVPGNIVATATCPAPTTTGSPST